MGSIAQKVQIRFAKGEPVRFVSHHDLMRLMQRALRRAALPVRMTEGFNPRPRMVLLQALELGIESRDEVAELELTQWVQPTRIAKRLREVMPEGIEIRAVHLAAPARKSRQPLEATYVADLPAAGIALTAADIRRFLERPAVPFLRTRQDKTKPIDLRPRVRGLERTVEGRLVMRLSLGDGTAARPREVLEALTGLDAQTLLAVRIVKTRTTLVPRRAARAPD